MKYVVFSTTNLKSKVNNLNRVYIGVHAMEDPEIFDGYLGDGVYIQQASTFKYPKTPFQYAVKKYGAEAFFRTILFVYDTPEEAYKKEWEIVDKKFVEQSHTYNMYEGGSDNLFPICQFDTTGKITKLWNSYQEIQDFYGYSRLLINNAIYNKCLFLNSFWSKESGIDINEYNIYKNNHPRVIYLFNADGKCIKEFVSEHACAEYLELKFDDVKKAILWTSLVQDKYYISNTVSDKFESKPRRSNMRKQIFVYDVNNKFYGAFTGKMIMRVIDLYSWIKIDEIFTRNHGWYKDFYLSETPIEKVPEKYISKFIVDVYDKYGNFIETINSQDELREKYNTPRHIIKRIQMGEKYYGDNIFKYHSL